MKRWLWVLTISSVASQANALLAQDITPLPEKPMPVDARPSFELATVKASPPDARGAGSGIAPGGRFTAHNLSVKNLMLFAYGLHPRQIEGGPAWLETARFDIAAKADTPGAPNKSQLMMMVQKLLADRFHREEKELAVYALSVQNSASKLTLSTGDPNGPPTVQLDPHGHFTARNLNMEEFAMGLQGNVLDRPTFDRTGLSGSFVFTLDWAPGEFQFPGTAARTPLGDNNAALPDLFTAFKDQLGLKLESTKALVEFLLVDHVERPSEN